MFEPIDILHQQQPSLIPNSIDSNIVTDQILDKTNVHSKHQSVIYTDMGFNNNDKLNNDDDLLNILTSEMFTELFNNTQFSEIKPDFDEIMELQNMFQHNMKNNTSNQLNSNKLISVQTNNLLNEPTTIDNVILTQSILQEEYKSCKDTLISKNVNFHQNQSTTVTPVNYTLNPNVYTPRNTVQVQNDVLKSKKIQIKHQPRSRYRPRTVNESKISSHYLRCEVNNEQDYPTIHVPQIWAYQSDINIIEVALVDIEKKPHPYSIDNKTSENSFVNGALIIKQAEPNILYFRLTNDDFVNGFKTFMIELIKSKQDNVITKKLIHMRKLDQSMLRFTRIYRNKYGKYERDVESEEYSCVMTENYGDVSFEQMGPRYGPMCGQEIVFIILKGRFVKDDISIIISEQTTKWTQEISNITLNGNVVYFSMPAFPYSQIDHVKASVSIYFKKQKLNESIYLYMNVLDQELLRINSNNSMPDIPVSMISNKLNHFHLPILTDRCSMPVIVRKASKNKSTKRLNTKSISL